MKLKLFLTAILLISLTGCNGRYLGEVMVTPERTVTVEDSNGKGLAGYDMYIYRCTHPGSQLDEVFLFKNQTESNFHLENKTEKQWKQSGGVWLAPDFYVSHEPKPYWVACVSKKGYQDRRWSLNESQGNPVVIKLKEGNGRGPDMCHTEKSECTACRSYEYFMYEPMRYRHSACSEKQALTTPSTGTGFFAGAQKPAR